MELRKTLIVLTSVCVVSSHGEVNQHEETLEPLSSILQTADDCPSCENESHIKQEKEKYHTDKVLEIFKQREGGTRDPTEEEIEDILREIEDEERLQVHFDNDNVLEKTAEEIVDETIGDYEFPKLVRVDPGQVGDVVNLELQEGKVYKRITRSLRPPVFEIPEFLTPEECDHIIKAARKNGLNTSNLFGAEINDQLNEGWNNSDISRISDQTWLGKREIGDDFWNNLHIRLARLTQLDIGVIDRSEPIQVVSYVPGGHYHAHMDTVETNSLPCCFQKRCGDKEMTASWSECCRLCRFITVLYYLNDVEAGGETAFPLADMSDDLYDEKMTNVGEQKWYNLSLFCHNSSLVVLPKRGTAVFWYSHFIDEKTGYLGPADQRSNHGGCDLLKGTKWIANNWISGTTFEDRFKPGIFYDP